MDTEKKRPRGSAELRAAKIVVLWILLFLTRAADAQELPASFFLFRDTVYAQNTEPVHVMAFYTKAKEEIERSSAGAGQYLALARCAYLMGIAVRAEGNKKEAAPFFEQGIAWAEQSIALYPSSEGHRLLGTNIAFLSESRISYGLRNFRRIEENGRKALELDPDNLAARHLIAALHIIAPWPFGNTRKGAAILDEIIARNYLDMEKEDLFNLYLIYQVACLKLRKNREAQFWQTLGEAIYPTNNFVLLLDRWGFLDNGKVPSD